MNRAYPALMLACLLYAVTAHAELIEERSQGQVSFISGGIGEDERAALKKVRTDYNLGLLFSTQGSGEYLSDVTVRISDGNGAIVLDTVSEGPMLFAKLKPGRYQVSAEHAGQALRKPVTVDAKHRSPLSFTWSNP
ncbi:carboxypeptidase regulatory-like domain-containing protein [Methylococcaceae bacterium WWC4]|nr:carboxypeptidase regulatory-like domain-containing protein [Methylococcaceae bacterium WWC4]